MTLTAAGDGRGGSSPRESRTIFLTRGRWDFHSARLAGTFSLPIGNLRNASGTPSQGACSGSGGDCARAAQLTKTNNCVRIGEAYSGRGAGVEGRRLRGTSESHGA